ncbi:MAG TPA: FecR domain-containing protein [Longimicrobiales bacterium]|nr:FecR domain-containing protein [Longimicrobiales bacterium]
METDTLLRYIAGEATPEEVRTVETWAAAGEGNARQLRVLRTAWHEAVGSAYAAPHGASGETAHRDAARDAALAAAHNTRGAPERTAAAHDDAAWRRIAARLDSPPAEARPARQPSLARRTLLRAAAITLLLAGAAVFALYRTGDAPASTEWVTAIGETGDIVLPDSSHVRLAPSSTLRVTDDFNGAERRVLLEGTAYFEVRRAEPRAFVVVTSAVETTVLGTAFMVRAYDDEPADVAVVEGRVSVAAQRRQAVQVQAGERAVVQDGAVSVRREDIRPLLAWRDGRLAFHDAALVGAARELERWYDVDVEITDERLEQRRVTLSVRAAPLGEVLDLLRASLGVPIEQRGRTVFIGGTR